MNNKPIQIAIVDDDKLVVQLLAEFLQKYTFFDVGVVAYSGNAFLKRLTEQDYIPEIVLLDLRMNDGDGIQTIEAILSDFPEIKIIVLSSYYKASSIGYMLKSGVSAFLPKETDKERLVKIIQEVNNKGHYFTEEQVSILRNEISHKVPRVYTSSKEALSDREVEVLRLICRQFTAKEIADKLYITTKTVEAHKSNLYLKTGVKNVAGLIIYAVQNKLIDPNEILLID